MRYFHSTYGYAILDDGRQLATFKSGQILPVKEIFVPENVRPGYRQITCVEFNPKILNVLKAYNLSGFIKENKLEHKNLDISNLDRLLCQLYLSDVKNIYTVQGISYNLINH